MTHSILIIEDNPQVREVLHPMIEIWLENKPQKFNIYEATQGEEAIQWIAEHGCPDWILLDVRMPIMNGAEFLQAMKAQGQNISHKTLLLTGYADDLDEYLGNEALAMKHLRKPFLAPELFTALDQLIGI